MKRALQLSGLLFAITLSAFAQDGIAFNQKSTSQVSFITAFEKNSGIPCREGKIDPDIDLGQQKLTIKSGGQNKLFLYKDFELLANPKTVKQTCFSAVNANDSIVEGILFSKMHSLKNYPDYAAWRMPVEYTFNDRGYLVTSINEKDEISYEIKKIAYDSLNRVANVSTYLNIPDKDSLEILTYDTRYYWQDSILRKVGHQYTPVKTANDSVTEQITAIQTHYFYYKNGLLYKEFCDEFPDGNKFIFYQYDEYGNQTKMIYQYPEGDINEWQTEYQYDEHGQVKNMIRTEGEGFTKTKYEYYENGLLKSKTRYQVVQTYKYEFDDKGNWIKKTVYVDDKPTFIYKRKISYF